MSLTLATAEQEYQRNPELKKEDIEKLREWIRTKPHLPMPTEEELIRFLHSCYYKIEETKKCIDVYYKLRSSTPEFFNDRDLSRPELKQAQDVLFYSSIPEKDENGYQIIFHSLQKYESSKYNFSDGVKLLVMAVDACLLVEGTSPGYIFLFDMKGVKLGHLARLSLSLLRKFFQYIQEGNPIRLKGIHVVNTLPIIDKIMFMIKPFMNKELLELVHFHSSDMSEVQKYLHKSCLPKDFDGDLPSCAELHEKYCDWMNKLKPFFDEEEARRSNNKKKECTEDVNLRNLNLD